MPNPELTDECNPAINKTYSVTTIATFNSTKDDWMDEVTPVLTVIKPANSTEQVKVEVHLNCLTPIHDGATTGSAYFQSGSAKLSTATTIAIIGSALFALRWLF